MDRKESVTCGVQTVESCIQRIREKLESLNDVDPLEREGVFLGIIAEAKRLEEDVLNRAALPEFLILLEIRIATYQEILRILKVEKMALEAVLMEDEE